MSHIMIRTEGRAGITVSLIFGLILVTPAWTEAGKISNADTADTLREVATASSSPLSNSAIVAILNAGTPVSETTTSTFSDGTTQTADLLIVPNTSAGTVTTTKDINLADGETEKVVDVASVTGNSSQSAITTTLPDGSTQTKDETDVTKGDKTTVKAKVSMAGGGTQTISGETVERGSKSITVETITNPAGQVYHDRIVITHDGSLSQSETNTTRGPGGSISTVKSMMSTVIDPSMVGQTALQESLGIPALNTAVQAPNLEAQVLASSPTTTDFEPTVLPVPLPEPGTLMFVGMVLGAAGLRRGWRRMRLAG
jgi:uncharacterized protein YaiI (UPF0178 family)